MSTALFHGLKYGLLLGLLLVSNVQILTWFGLGLTSWVIAGDTILLILITISAHVTFKLKTKSALTFKDALLVNMAIILIAGLISQAYMYVYLTFIEPDWVDKVAEMRRQLLIDNGADSGGIDQRIASFRKAFTPVEMFTRGLIIPGLWDFLIAGIVAIFTKGKHRVSKDSSPALNDI